MIKRAHGSVLQGFFHREGLRGSPVAGVVQAGPSRMSAPHAPRPDLLPPAMRGGAAQPRLAEPPHGIRALSLAPAGGITTILPGMVHPAGLRGASPIGGIARARPLGMSPPHAPRPAWPPLAMRSGAVQPRLAAPSGGIRAIPLAPGQLRIVGAGRPLAAEVRAPFEAFFEADLSSVRVHEGPAASALGAAAFTLGEDIYFAPGLFTPHDRDGLGLLGHELAHVVQQREGRVHNPFAAGVAVVQDPVLEAEAERLGRIAGGRVLDAIRAPRTSLLRDWPAASAVASIQCAKLVKSDEKKVKKKTVPKIVYHGTTEAGAIAIKKNGLQPRDTGIKSGDAWVCVTPNIGGARTRDGGAGDVVLIIDTTPFLTQTWKWISANEWRTKATIPPGYIRWVPSNKRASKKPRDASRPLSGYTPEVCRKWREQK